jgi:signal transduction histidine kinase/CheY-like chemotaxis protein
MAKRSITKTLFLYISISIITIIGSLAAHMIFSVISKKNKSIEQKKQSYIKHQKKLLKNQVDLTIQFINYEKTFFENAHHFSLQDLKDSILEQIAKIRFDNNGYIFVVSYDGTTLMNDVQRNLIGENQWDITDPDGIKIVQEEYKVAQNPDGGFIFYSWFMPNTEIPTPKISFIKAVPEWQWMVGSGIYLEDINNIISQEHKKLKEEIKQNIIQILVVFGLLIILLLLIVKYIKRKTKEGFSVFSDFFNKAAQESTKINIEDLYFSEFVGPAEAANEMISELNQAKNRLLKFNEELEVKVKERTSEITQQKEEILSQNEEIRSQKEEIENHRNHLERLVEKRTKDFELAKEKAEESDRLKSSFLANMSHEIRTPMNAIIGFSNLLMEGELDSESKLELNREITKSGFALLNLIENILDLAKIETKQIKIKKTEFSFKELLKEIHYYYTEITANKKFSFILNPDIQEDIIIFSDQERMQQILKNLIENAIKYTEEGTVELGYQTENNYISVFVKDTGIGMNKQQLDHIFTRFTKIEDKKQKLYEGAGLGLAICKNLVELLEGEINVESEIGKGSIFTIKIPIKQINKFEVSDKLKSEYNERYNWSNKTILIAEDDDSNFRFFTMTLSETNINIIRAKNGIEAVEKSVNKDINMILMDIKMPEMDGLEATERIKKENPDITIIAQTAFAMENDKELSLEAGCNAYIQKPIQKVKLLSLMNKFLS